FVRTVVRDAINNRRVPHDALVGFKIPRAHKKDINTLTEDEMKLIINNCSSYKYELVIRLLILTGARAGEVLGLCEDVSDFKKGSITIQRTMNLQTGILKEEPKTSNSYRTSFLDDETTNLLKEHISKNK